MGFQYTSDQEIAAKLGYTKPSQLFTPDILCEIEEGTVISVLKEFADHSGDKI